MRPIERRLAVVEARTTLPASARHRVFLLPREQDETAFRARCEAEAKGQICHFIRFVRPSEVMLAAALH